MARVRFKKGAEISIPDAAFAYADMLAQRRKEGSTDKEEEE